MSRVSDLKALGLLTLLMLAISLPFVRRAYFVDDFYFVTMAKGIVDHPMRPYDFVSDDAGIANVAWERGKQPRMVNPPLFHYFLAAVIALAGDAVWVLRTASLLFPLISLYAVFFLGKRFVKNSLAAASLLAITPAFWLTSYSLLIDSALLAFFLAALACFIEGQDRNSWRLLAFSGLLMGLTLLTKYTGALIVPVVLLWQWMHRERGSWAGTWLALGVCGVVFVLWGVWGILTYGQPHFTATLSRGFHPAAALGLAGLTLFVLGACVRWWGGARAETLSIGFWGIGLMLVVGTLWRGVSLGTWLQTFYFDKFIGVASFLGGSSVFLFFTPALWKGRNPRALAACCVVSLLLFVCFASPYGGFDRVQSATLAFFIGSTIAFLVLASLKTPRTAARSQRFLFAWLTIGLLELVVVMPWTAARYLLVILPPVVWMFRRLTEESGHLRVWRWAWGVTALMGVALAYVDYAQAGVIVPLSRLLEVEKPRFALIAPRPPHHWYYLADTFDGSQPYVLRWGWENVFPFQKFESGSLFLRSVYRKSSWWTVSDPQRFQPLAVWEFTSWVPLRVMDVPASAGLYASCWGVLPYAITLHPLERFELYRVK